MACFCWLTEQSYGQQGGRCNHLLVVNSVSGRRSAVGGRQSLAWEHGGMETGILNLGFVWNLVLGIWNLFAEVLQDRFTPCPYLQLFIYVAQVGADGFDADEEQAGDFFVKKSFDEV